MKITNDASVAMKVTEIMKTKETTLQPGESLETEPNTVEAKISQAA